MSIVFAAAVATAAIGVTACGPIQPTCGPGTCKGCCNADGVCETGVLDATCGTSGEQCKACATGTSCNLGFCVTPAQCGGCTNSNGACVSGTNDSACGGGGAACKACEANEVCANRACQKVCKDLNGACINDSECCSGRCGVFGLCAEPVTDGGPNDGGGDAGDDGGFDAGEDGGRDGGDGGTCGPECATQGPMDPSCSPCAASVCSFDSYCCTNAWDSTCVGEAEKTCGLFCGGFDGGGFDGGGFDAGPFDGGVCGPECAPQPAPMDPSCSPCVATVCQVDGYCCATQWDTACVSEAQTYCGLMCGGGFDGGFIDGGFFDGGSSDGGFADAGSADAGPLPPVFSDGGTKPDAGP